MDKKSYISIRKKLDFSFRPDRFALHFWIDAILLGSIYFAFQRGGAVALLAAIPLSIYFFRNFGLMHEAVHGLAHPNAQVNHALGFISGALCFLPFYLWKKIHIEHHYWAGNYEKDPTLTLVKKFPQASASSQKITTFFWKTSIPVPALLQHIVFWSHAGVHWIQNLKKPSYWMSFFFPVGFWVGVVWVLHGFQLAGLALGVLLYMCLVEAINLPHHAGIYIEEITPEAHLPIWDQYKVSRSCQYHPLIQKFVVLHFNYHAEHHLFPDLPWHQLDKAHKLLGDSEIKHELKVIGNSWMSQKRKESFGEFIRPHSEKKKSSEAA